MGALCDDELYEATSLPLDAYAATVRFLVTHKLISRGGQAPHQTYTITPEGLETLNSAMKAAA
jgi:RIO-like serine/threonine protein kinase